MDEFIAKYISSEMSIKLTSEKLFIETPSSNETFALRSVNGIGVVDLIDEYNSALSVYNMKLKQKKSVAYVLIGYGAIILLCSLFCFSFSVGFVFFLVLLGGGLLVWGINKLNENNLIDEPNLMSAVRIMMSGGNRDFKFDKTGNKTTEIASLVAKVEETLTAYHKN